MRVWIQNPFDNLPAEGFRRQRFSLMAGAFVAAGHDVTLWTSDFNHGTKAKRVFRAGGGPESGVDFKVRLVPTAPYPTNVCRARVRSHRRYAADWMRLAADEPAPDVIITSVPTVSAAVAAHRLAARFRAKFVVDVMDAWPETFERLAPSGLKWCVRILLSGVRRRVRELYRAADLVTGVCARYRALTGRADYVLAYHGIERRADACARRESFGPRLVYVGNLGEGYDLGTAIDGVRALRAAGIPATLDIAGRGPREAEWRARAGERLAAGVVRFHGYLAADELTAVLDACDIGIIPMRDDSWVGLPYKLGDYAAAGLRVVSSLQGETGDLLARLDAGATYARGDADSFARAVRTAMDDCRGESGALLVELDASRIYGDYVKKIEALA